LKTRSQYQYLFLLFFVLIGLASCKTSKVITAEKVRPMSTNRLIKKVADNAFNYKELAIKRIACQYEGPNERTSFRANLKSEKDKQMIVTLSKINLPVARIYLTPDSVKMVNYLNKTYLKEDYQFLAKFVGADVDFNMIQDILCNDAFSYRNGKRNNDFKEFVSYVDSGMYVLQSFKNRKLDKIYRKGKEDKIDRYLNKLDEDDFIVQHIYIDPKTFKIRKIVIDDKSNKRKVDIDFSDFVKVGSQLYPGNINMNFTSPEKDLSMKIKLSKFSTEKHQSFNFNIPGKYTRTK